MYDAAIPNQPTTRLPPKPPIAEPALSVFHQGWWLDIATDGAWAEALVHENGIVVGRWPYPIRTQYGLPVTTMPTLIRTLGPLVSSLPGKPASALRRHTAIINQLIDQLPPTENFEQVFDPSVVDGLPFIYRGFVVNVAYCFRLPAGRSVSSMWNGMIDKTRNVIRRAADTLQVGAVADPDEFCRFHDANQGSTENMHGTRRMRALIAACLQRDAGLILGARNAQGNLEAAVTFAWDAMTCYYLLAARNSRTSPNGAVSLLIWHGMQMSAERGLAFDFDGAVTPGMSLFLSGFGGTPTQRLRVRRVSPLYRILDGAARLVGYGQRTASDCAAPEPETRRQASPRMVARPGN